MFGYKYILNIKTGEVHFEDNTKLQCGVSKMSDKNKKYLTKRQYTNLKYTYYNHKWVNGCVHCNQANNKE